MPSAPLSFTPPLDEGIVALRIHEAPTADGPFVQIERTLQVGTYPDYISHYTTDQAVSATDWFAIQWEDYKGALSSLSVPVKGGTETLVHEITERVLLRDGTVNENVAAQEAEAVIESYFQADPYSVDPSTVSYTILSGLVMLTLARSYLMGLYASGSGKKFTAGLISLDTTATAKRSLDDIQKYINAANTMLGRTYSAVLLLKEIETGGGLKQLVDVDTSRLIVEYD
jgi:hypothetical protein